MMNKQLFWILVIAICLVIGIWSLGFWAVGCSSTPQETATTSTSITSTTMVAISAVGTPDASFGTNGTTVYDTGMISPFPNSTDDRGNSIAIDRNGKILVAGYRWPFGGKKMAIWRYDSDGALDKSFGDNGVTLTSLLDPFLYGQGNCMIIDSNNNILVAGISPPAVALWRYKSDGIPDNNFGASGKAAYATSWESSANAVAIDSSGKILVTGYLADKYEIDSIPYQAKYMAIWRYNTDGSTDGSFGTNGIVIYYLTSESRGNNIGNAIVADSHNNILVAGYSFNAVNVINVMTVWRYNSNGTTDESFGDHGKTVIPVADPHSPISSKANSIIIDPSGYLLVTGKYNGKMAIWRLTTNGEIDSSFGNGGMVTDDIGTDNGGTSIISDSLGRILVTGDRWNGSGFDMAIWRYDAKGNLDPSFGNNGILTDNVTNQNYPENGYAFGNSIRLDDFGRILVTGYVDYPDSNRNMVIWRYR